MVKMIGENRDGDPEVVDVLTPIQTMKIFYLARIVRSRTHRALPFLRRRRPTSPPKIGGVAAVFSPRLWTDSRGKCK